MSIANSPRNAPHAVDSDTSRAPHIQGVLQAVEKLIAPVWPLRDYVAVNPYGGLSDKKFLAARQHLQRVSDCETLMPKEYYQHRARDGKLSLLDIQSAIAEMAADQVPGVEQLSAKAVYTHLMDQAASPEADLTERFQPISEHYDRVAGSSWTGAIQAEIGKHCAAHYDEGQAAWPAAWRQLPLYQAWRSAALVDRHMEFLGLKGFRRTVSQLPHTADAAIQAMLESLDLPHAAWQPYLECLALSIPGWSSWTKFKTEAFLKQGVERDELAGLLAMRLAYDVAIAKQHDFNVHFASTPRADHAPRADPVSDQEQQALVGFALLRASEIALRREMLPAIANAAAQRASKPSQHEGVSPKLAQLVFCIDVRSERIRRNLESVSSDLETFGFAGFFGLPFEYVRLGDQSGTNQLPVLLEPQFKVYEDVRSDETTNHESTVVARRRIRNVRDIWKRFQTSAVSCFAFVETTGLLYGAKLLSKLFRGPASTSEYDGVCEHDHQRLGPGFRNLHRQGISTTKEVDMAESILRGLGLTKGFARLVMFCGHGSTTENNPLQAGLDCGACGGHSGEPNARLAAMLLNHPYIRAELVERGIEIPAHVHFLGALHDTTTDEIKCFDLDLLPDSHQDDLAEIRQLAAIASEKTRRERLATLPGETTETLIQRSRDWSEVRPEWGLTGNAAFVIGPRALTKDSNLDGASFLHSYDYRNDVQGVVLEQIMTAPLVVANWINMQYYASTVDQKHFGSGNKTLHNVVGKFGVYCGNDGDLTTGLPWQSIHNGESFQHHPMRLLTVIEAPRANIHRILDAHANVNELVSNGWIQLIAIEDGRCYRRTETGEWRQVSSAPKQDADDDASRTTQQPRVHAAAANARPAADQVSESLSQR